MDSKPPEDFGTANAAERFLSSQKKNPQLHSWNKKETQIKDLTKQLQERIYNSSTRTIRKKTF